MILKEGQEERKGIEKKFYDLCLKVVKEEGLDLYDLDYDHIRSCLRLYIFDKKTETAVLEDCILIDKALSPFFDQEEWIPETLTLEVSSPGVFRSLRTVSHFERALNKWISVVVNKKWGEKSEKEFEKIPLKLKKKKKFRGILLEIKDHSIALDVSESQKRQDEQVERLEIYFDEIKKANLDPEWS